MIAGKTLKPFDASLKLPKSERSDIDLAVVSPFHFDAAWRDLRLAAQPVDPLLWGRKKREKMDNQRFRLFDGAILAHVFLLEFSFGTTWIPGMVKVRQEAAIALGMNVKINMWIYRDYWSIRNYVAEGIMKCRSEVVL